MIQEYLNEITSKFNFGVAREHAYRTALEKFIELNFEIDALNDPSRSEHGNPDFVFFPKGNKDLILGYAETKDVTVSLDKVENSEQLQRYMGYSSLILTNYLNSGFIKMELNNKQFLLLL